MIEPLFSIIIPTYNRVAFISKAIESVLVQTFADWELIIIDDGSTDNTKEIIAHYTDKRIQYIYQVNAERCAARNNGIQNSAGKYICFLDSDDYYLPNRLELLYQELKNRNFPTAAFYTGLVSESKDVLTEINCSPEGTTIFDQIALSTIHSQQVCIRKNILKKINYDSRFHIGEDMELWLRIANEFPFVFIPNQYTVVVVDHSDRSVNVKRNNSYFYQMQMLRQIFSKNHSGYFVSKHIKLALISNCYFGMAKYYIYKGANWKAFKNLCFSILSDLSNKQNKYRLNIIIHMLLKRNKVIALIEG